MRVDGLSFSLIFATSSLEPRESRLAPSRRAVVEARVIARDERDAMVNFCCGLLG